MDMLCQKCGKELNTNDKFCSKCGAKVEPQNIAEYPNFNGDLHNNHVTPTEQTKQKLNRKHIKFTIVWIVCCVAAVFAIVYAAESFTDASIENSKTTTNHITEKATKKVYDWEIATDNSTKKSTEKPTDNPTEKPTERPTEKTTEKPTDVVETMTKLFTNYELTIYYSDCEPYRYSDDRTEVHLFVENKTNKSITVQAETVILDGISYNKLVCSDPISANSRGMIEISVEDCTNVNPSTVGADLRYFETNQIGDTTHINISSQDVK